MGNTPRTREILDELLVLESQQGDRRALELLASRWHRRLLAHAARLTGAPDAAADAVQETWLAIVRGLGRLDDPARFKAWAYRIVSHKCSDWIRRQDRQRRFDRRVSAEPAAVASGPVDKTSTEDPVGRLRTALRRLPEDRRALLSMLYLEGLSVKEIAGALAIPEGTVKSRLFHARQALRRALDRTEEDRP